MVQVLVGEGHVDHQLRLHLLDQGHQFGHVVGIDLGGLDAVAQLGGDGVALALGARGQGDFAEDIAALGAFVGHDLPDAAGTDDQNFAHDCILLTLRNLITFDLYNPSPQRGSLGRGCYVPPPQPSPAGGGRTLISKVGGVTTHNILASVLPIFLIVCFLSEAK